MKIAIATNDRKNIAKRTGRSVEFAIYQIENGKVQSIDYQKNTHTHHDNHDRNEGNHHQGHIGHSHRNGSGQGHNHSHNHENGAHNHNEIITQLKGVDMFLVRAIGKYMKKDLQNGNIPYQLVKEDNITEIISNYLKMKF